MATPSEWIHESEGDLATARKLIDPVSAKHACFFAQQAAEKALKAILLKATDSVPRSHDLVPLHVYARQADPSFPDLGGEALALAKYYTFVRYPDARAPGTPLPSIAEAADACRMADAIVQAARARIP